MAQYQKRIASALAVAIGIERSADFGGDSERIKVIGGDELALHLFGSVQKNRSHQTACDGACKYVVVIAKLNVLVIREVILDISGTAVLEPSLEAQDPARIGNRNRFQRNRIVNGEKGRIDADSQRDRENGN